MNISEQIELLRAWLEGGDFFTVNGDGGYVLADADPSDEGIMVFESDIDTVVFDNTSGYPDDHVAEITWSEEPSDDYGPGPYCHIATKGGHGYEIRSFTLSQRSTPEGAA